MEVEYLHEIVLGLIQGLTEFLPVSSAAHLILLPRLLGWEDQGLEMDVAAHLGTLCAVIYYFRHEFKAMFSSAYSSRCSFSDPQSRYLWFLILATVPVAITGLVAGDIVANHLRHPLVIASATLFFAVVLWTSDYFGKRNRGENSLTWKDVLLIGCFQVLALIPGTSRSGITITAGLILGLDHHSAARFSFLLAVPTILLAATYEGFKLFMTDVNVDWVSMVTVTLVSFVTAALTIHYFLKFLSWTGMMPYIIYRLILGCVLFVLFV
jgi:undecaprenyl-diphosphatase